MHKLKLFFIRTADLLFCRLFNFMGSQGMILGSNTLTNLIPAVHVGLDRVSRELTGLIPAVTRDPSVDRAAVGQTVTSFSAPAAAASDITPGVTPPDDGDQTIGNIAIQITKARRVPFRWNGEQSLGLNNGGAGNAAIRQDQVNQAIRTLVNEMEADLAGLYVDASRQHGVGGTVPFATAGDHTDATKTRQILVDNGAGSSELQMVLNTGASSILTGIQSQVDKTGSDIMLRQGVLVDRSGLAIRESAQIMTHVKGTGTSYTSSTAGFAIGVTTVPLITGSGTVLAGDTVTFAGDTNKYVVATGVAAPGSIVLAEPGLRQALPASAVALTVAASGPRSMAFAKSAIVLATRAPALPDGGDLAVDRQLITDPVSGMTFEIAMYAQYRQMQYEISAVWGVKTIKPEHFCLLAG